jgi:putative tryptophan/tyrosine transport system substrate-binding protein
VKRRAFITGSGAVVAVWPVAAYAEQAVKVSTIGFLGPASSEVASPWVAAFVRRLNELGWFESQNLAIEYRWANGRYDQLARLAEELSRAHVDALVTWSDPAALAVQKSTSVIPIIFAASSDPVEAGLVPSLSRPGGNMTGVSSSNVEIATKRVELLREIVPLAHKLAILAISTSTSEINQVREAAHKLGMDVTMLDIKQAEDIGPAFEALKGEAQALFIVGSPFTLAHRAQINTLAQQARLPTMYYVRESVAAGGLMSYGPNFPDLFRRTAELVDKILRGTKPSDIPVEQPTKFDFAINLIGRRRLIAGLGSLATCPFIARGQQSVMPLVGYITARPDQPGKGYAAAFRKGLGETGYVEGQNVAIEYRWTEAQNSPLPAFVSDFIDRRVDVIAPLSNTAAALAAKAATQTIPIVFRIGGDPVASGLVASLNRPGGNVTGVTTLGAELEQKRVELLRDLFPPGALVGALVNPTNANVAVVTEEIQAAAHHLGVRLLIWHTSAPSEIEAAFASVGRQGISGVLMIADNLFFVQRDLLVTLAARTCVPTIYTDRSFAEAGGLMSYGTDIPDGFRVAGVYTGRILKGERPADLPVQRSTKTELVINMKTAKALGLTIPESFLLRADEVIE